jgi:hypothetical protein
MGEGNFPIPAGGKGRGEDPPQFEGSGRGRPLGSPGGPPRREYCPGYAPLVEASSNGSRRAVDKADAETAPREGERKSPTRGPARPPHPEAQHTSLQAFSHGESCG